MLQLQIGVIMVGIGKNASITICYPVNGLLIYGEIDNRNKAHSEVMVMCTTECRESKVGDCKEDCLNCPHQDLSKEKKYLKQYRKAMIRAVNLAYAELNKVGQEGS